MPRDTRRAVSRVQPTETISQMPGVAVTQGIIAATPQPGLGQELSSVFNDLRSVYANKQNQQNDEDLTAGMKRRLEIGDAEYDRLAEMDGKTASYAKGFSSAEGQRLGINFKQDLLAKFGSEYNPEAGGAEEFAQQYVQKALSGVDDRYVLQGLLPHLADAYETFRGEQKKYDVQQHEARRMDNARAILSDTLSTGKFADPGQPKYIEEQLSALQMSNDEKNKLYLDVLNQAAANGNVSAFEAFTSEGTFGKYIKEKGGTALDKGAYAETFNQYKLQAQSTKARMDEAALAEPRMQWYQSLEDKYYARGKKVPPAEAENALVRGLISNDQYEGYVKAFYAKEDGSVDSAYIDRELDDATAQAIQSALSSGNSYALIGMNLGTPIKDVLKSRGIGLTPAQERKLEGQRITEGDIKNQVDYMVADTLRDVGPGQAEELAFVLSKTNSLIPSHLQEKMRNASLDNPAQFADAYRVFRKLRLTAPHLLEQSVGDDTRYALFSSLEATYGDRMDEQFQATVVKLSTVDRKQAMDKYRSVNESKVLEGVSGLEAETAGFWGKYFDDTDLTDVSNRGLVNRLIEQKAKAQLLVNPDMDAEVAVRKAAQNVADTTFVMDGELWPIPKGQVNMETFPNQLKFLREQYVPRLLKERGVDVSPENLKLMLDDRTSQDGQSFMLMTKDWDSVPGLAEVRISVQELEKQYRSWAQAEGAKTKVRSRATEATKKPTSMIIPGLAPSNP